jgi:hypothetical protein
LSFVKDNPEPFTFGVVGVGCIPILEVSTTQLEFEKMLVKHTRTIEVELRNLALIPTCWRIKNPNQFQELFHLSATNRTIAPQPTQILAVTYLAGKAQNVKRQMLREVVDKSNTRIYSSHHLVLLAESFDVNVDFIYP